MPLTGADKTAADRLQQIADTQAVVKELLRLSKDRLAARRTTFTPTFQPGDLVHLSTKGLNIKSQSCQKLKDGFLGPYKVLTRGVFCGRIREECHSIKIVGWSEDGQHPGGFWLRWQCCQLLWIIPGFVIIMCGAATASGSHLQPTAALSTVEAEYMALAVAAQEVKFLRQLLTSEGIVEKQPTRMFEDNKGCISLATNAMTTGKTKHIDIRLHFLRDLVQNGNIEVIWCPTDDMLADALTNFSLPT